MLFLSMLFFAAMIGCYDFKIVNAATTTMYGFSDVDYENEVGDRERSATNKRRYPFLPSNISISTPRLRKLGNGQFQLVYQYGYPITKGGAERYLEYRVKFSRELEDLVSGISITPVGAKADPKPSKDKQKYNFENRIRQDSDGHKVFSSGVYLGSGYNGGDANIYITLKRSFIPQEAFIASYMVSSTEVRRPVYPSFEAVRILQYENFGQLYNEELLKTEKEEDITRLKRASESLINKINGSGLSQNLKATANHQIESIVNDTIEQVNSQTAFENSTLEVIENLVDTAIFNMTNLFDNLSEVTITSLPHLDFGVQFIRSRESIYETIDDQVVEGLLVLMNASATSSLSISLSISEFQSENHTLKTMYMMGEQAYAPNTTFTFVSGSQKRSGKFAIIKKPSEGVKLIVYPDNLYAKSYTATATWSITNGP